MPSTHNHTQVELDSTSDTLSVSAWGMHRVCYEGFRVHPKQTPDLRRADPEQRHRARADHYFRSRHCKRDVYYIQINNLSLF